ncbi:MAG: hypothetical protein JRN58_04255 [Nitrososphaerota archaeon]|nr:hypothetical protein [Nitrososphaerota archaeon]MDG6978277.1 hypothetical protein [Nitrososphaerota archaeon]
MKLRQFLSVLGVVALLAVVYSPSTISFSASPGGDGGTAPTDTSASGTSLFLAYLQQSGYQVTVATTPQQVVAAFQAASSPQQRLVYILIGADTPLTSQELQSFDFQLINTGRVSALIAEGNTTNDALLATVGARATGHAIVDPTSPFEDKEVFPVGLSLGPANITGVIDVASPLLLTSGFLHPVATSSPSSYDTANSTVGPRTVVAAGTSPKGARVVVLTDSGPFTNYLFNGTQGVDEKPFVAAMLQYVDPGKAYPILLDAAHYNAPQPLSFQAGLPIGPLVAYALEQDFSSLNAYYASFPAQVGGFLGGFGVHVSAGAADALVALIILFSVYGALTRWFAHDKKGRDDRPAPSVERTIVAESAARTSFLETSRSKAGYVAALSQLYEVIDPIVVAEFGDGLASVGEAAMAARLGADEAKRAKRLFLTLSRFHDYAAGRGLLFPPVVRWRALTARTTGEAEAFLNRLGLSIAGEEEAERLVSERARA